jgi:hypothetical protein
LAKFILCVPPQTQYALSLVGDLILLVFCSILATILERDEVNSDFRQDLPCYIPEYGVNSMESPNEPSSRNHSDAPPDLPSHPLYVEPADSSPKQYEMPPATDRYVLAIISLVLGILNLCAWFIPLCGGSLAIVGLILGVLGLNSSRKGMAIAGIVLSGIALLLSIGNATFGAYLGLTGGYPFIYP